MMTITTETGCTETTRDEGEWCEERETVRGIEDGFIGNRCNDEE